MQVRDCLALPLSKVGFQDARHFAIIHSATAGVELGFEIATAAGIDTLSKPGSAAWLPPASQHLFDLVKLRSAA